MYSLPTTENLLTQGKVVPNVCPLCSGEDPSLLHLFFNCVYAVEVWKYAGLEDRIQTANHLRGEMRFRRLMKEQSESVAEVMLMLFDGVWFQRNKMIFEQTHIGPRQVVASVLANLESFKAARGWREDFSADLLPNQLLRPPENTPLVFFDAGLWQGMAGLGVVVTDADGRFLGAEARRVPNVDNSELAEMMALRAGLELALSKVLRDFNLVGDALSVVNMINGDGACSLHCTELLSQISQRLQGLGTRVYWVLRLKNKEAHSVAKVAKLDNAVYTSWDIPPSFLSNVSARFPEP